MAAKKSAQRTGRPTTKKTTKKAAKKTRSTAKRSQSTAKRSATAAKRATKKTAKKATKRASSGARKTTSAARKTAVKSTRRVQGTAKKAARKVSSTARKASSTARKTAPATRRSTGGPSNRRNGASRVDALTLLKQDHREVEEMFKRFERASGRRKEQLRDSIVEALSKHATIEEQVFYPAVRKEVRGTESTVLEALEEHHVVKLSLRECEDMAPGDERFSAKMTVMMENVRHHVKEEERELFPKVRRAIGRPRLLEIGDALQAAKRGAPSRPHPFSPDEPPANVIVGSAAAVMDRARTTGKRAVRRVRQEIHV